MNWRGRKDMELDEEIRAHLAMSERERRERGEPAEGAAAAAQREFGNVALVKEVTREMWGWGRAERWLQDVRYALRSLRAQPGFAVTAIVSLAVGIGANVAAFSVADAMLLRPLAVREPDRVMTIHGSTPQDGFERVSYPEWREIRAACRECDGVVAHRMFRFSVARPQDPVPQVRMGMQVSEGFFEVLGVRPVLGRGFTSEESAVVGRYAVAVLSYSYWRQEMGGDPAVVGSTVRVNGTPFTVVGVMPEEFTGMDAFIRPAMYVPLTMAAGLSPGRGREMFESRESRDLLVKARLRDAATKEQAQPELQALAAAQAELEGKTRGRRTLRLRTELESRLEEAPANRILVALLALLSALVLGVACANVAGLLLARAQARRREIAVRLAIGAGRWRLFQQMLTESLVLALLGGAAGCALAYAAASWLAAIQIPTDTPIVLATRLDARAMGFALAISLVAVLAFGLVPAWRAVAGHPGPALKSREEADGGRLRLRGRNLLVGAQVALSLVLLVVTGAMLDAFRQMIVADPGIRTDHVMMVEFDPSLVQYDSARTQNFYQQLKERVAQLVGVRGVTLARGIPFRPNFTDESVVPEGYDLPPGQDSVRVAANMVDENYFAVMRTPLLAGRGILRSDVAGSPRVAVVNEEFARRYWAGQSAVGRRFRMGMAGEWVQVVGVARTAKYLSLMEPPTPYFYLSLMQTPQSRSTLLVQTEGEPQSITSAVLGVVRDLDPNQPVYNVRPMDSFYAQGVLGLARVVLQMVMAMGLAGMLLALVGLYGLVAYSVSRRTREIGIRMAVGAGRGEVLRMVLRQGLTLALAGATVGMMLSVPMFRLLRAGFAGLGELSLWTLLTVPLLLAAMTAAACLEPARRASRIDPTRALHFE